MRKPLALLLLLILPLLALSQNVTVPKNVYFADIHLKLSDEAQQEIQKKVDALLRYPAYFQKKVELADAYFPIIERVFKEEGVPDDFKFLALQESGLIGDAVSTSNAVGYWQFKKEAASDFNLRMDNVVDERSHIIEASRGAARYFKRSNAYYNNWFTSLLSYYLGYSGVKAYTSPADKGANKMEVTEKSHTYVITFLAHKIAYENFIGKSSPAVSLRELRANPGQSLSEIALATKTDYAELAKYNKWLLGNAIPSDKDYYVMVPVRNGGSDSGLLATIKDRLPARQNQASAPAAMAKRNGLNVLVARPGDSFQSLAGQAGLSERRFLKYNDLQTFDKVQPGTAYYIERKNTTADTEFHVVQPGEGMQQIAQHYGVRLSYLLFKNRMSRSEVPAPGRVLWLQKRRPASVPVEIRDLSKQTSTTVEAKSTAAATPNSPETDDRPKENIFTRFINSFKRFKKQPATAAEETPATVATAEEPVSVQATEPDAAIQPAGKPVAKKDSVVKAPAAVEDTATVSKDDDWALYPGTATENAAAKNQPVTSRAAAGIAKSTATPAIADEHGEESPFREDDAETAATQPAPKPRPATANSVKHTVKQGETLYSISRMYAVSINDLNQWNSLGDAPLKIGQVLLIAEPLAAPAQAQNEPQAAPAASATGTHLVATGETLYQISKQYSASLQDLRNWNNLTDNSIRVGQELYVSAPAGTPATPAKATEPEAAAGRKGNTYHTVATGESMYQISRKYGVTIKDIMEWNNKSDFSVSIGEKLLIKKK